MRRGWSTTPTSSKQQLRFPRLSNRLLREMHPDRDSRMGPLAPAPSNTADVRTTFMPSSALPVAARVIADRAREAGVRVAATSAAESVSNACQLALRQRDYSDAPANPRGRERLLREIAESPAVDELAAIFTQFILTRFGSQVP